MAENNSNQVGGVLAAFAVGALVGAAVALLYAPRSGKDTRELITDKGRDIKNKVTDAMDDMPGFIEGKKADLAAAFDSGKEAVRDELSKRFKSA
jgi:gas vesicle protein